VAQPAATTCSNASALSQRYINDGSRYPVRCGPQDGASFPPAGAATAPAQGTQVASAAAVRPGPAIRVPEGYRKVWTDDRLNPNRGGRTAMGKAQMDLVWTETVPRRLVDTSSGTDVTRQFPKLYYPHTSYASQEAALARGARIVPRSAVVSTKAAVTPRRAAPATAARAGAQYVQVATFAVPANARNTVRRLQNAGLPVRVGQYSRGGKNYQVVLAGPFASQGRMGAALDAVRRAGFADAFLR
jgi:cell division septation protein DedD